MDKYDVVIIYSGFAGARAIQATARAGLKVLLLERRGRLVSEVPEETVFDALYHAVVTGVTTVEDRICDSEKPGKKIRSVEFVHEGKPMSVEADCFIDATNDGKALTDSPCIYAFGEEDTVLLRHFEDAIAENEDLYQIPYRATVPEDLNNLWITGRCFPLIHESSAKPALRATLGGIGEGVGVLAAFAHYAHARNFELTDTQIRNCIDARGLLSDDSALFDTDIFS